MIRARAARLHQRGIDQHRALDQVAGGGQLLVEQLQQPLVQARPRSSAGETGRWPSRPAPLRPPAGRRTFESSTGRRVAPRPADRSSRRGVGATSRAKAPPPDGPAGPARCRSPPVAARPRKNRPAPRSFPAPHWAASAAPAPNPQNSTCLSSGCCISLYRPTPLPSIISQRSLKGWWSLQPRVGPAGPTLGLLVC